MLNSILGILNIADLRKKFLFTIGMILVFRLGAHIPVSGIDPVKLSAIFGQANLLGFLDLFTGGALVKFSVFAMGIVPYINASIIMQLLVVVIPQLEALSKEGDEGRRRIAQYTRYFTVVLAAVQATGMAFWLRGVLRPEFNF